MCNCVLFNLNIPIGRYQLYIQSVITFLYIQQLRADRVFSNVTKNRDFSNVELTLTLLVSTTVARYFVNIYHIIRVHTSYCKTMVSINCN